MRPRWERGPAELVLVRHGESMGNRADQAARDAGAEELDLDVRDADVELSDTGREQARPRPVPRDVLRAEHVGPAFIAYLDAGWDDLVAG